jgi:hypothetical protein
MVQGGQRLREPDEQHRSGHSRGGRTPPRRRAGQPHQRCADCAAPNPSGGRRQRAGGVDALQTWLPYSNRAATAIRTAIRTTPRIPPMFQRPGAPRLFDPGQRGLKAARRTAYLRPDGRPCLVSEGVAIWVHRDLRCSNAPTPRACRTSPDAGVLSVPGGSIPSSVLTPSRSDLAEHRMSLRAVAPTALRPPGGPSVARGRRFVRCRDRWPSSMSPPAGVSGGRHRPSIRSDEWAAHRPSAAPGGRPDLTGGQTGEHRRWDAYVPGPGS